MRSVRNRSLVSIDLLVMYSLYLRHPILTRRPRLHDCQRSDTCLVQPNYHGTGRHRFGLGFLASKKRAGMCSVWRIGRLSIEPTFTLRRLQS